MSVKSKGMNDTDLEIKKETTAIHKCPKCNSKMIKRVKSRLNQYTHKKCQNCGFGYIIGR